MRRVCGITMAFAIVGFAAYAAPALEARPLGGLESGVWSILRKNDPRIREELKLTESQMKKIEELIAESEASSGTGGIDGKIDRQKLRDRLELNRRHAKTVSSLLTKTQLIRAEQIYLQRINPALTFLRPPVAAALKLSEEQKKKMTLIRKEFSQEFRGLLPAKGDKQEKSQKIAALRNKEEEKLLNALTSAQKTKWKKLLGKPFKLEPRRTEDKKQPSQGSDKPALPK